VSGRPGGGPLDLDLDPLPDGAGPIGLLSGDEFTPAVAAFDRALLELTGSRVALITCADPTHAARNAEIGRAHFATLDADAFHLTVPLNEELPAFDLAYIAGGDPAVLLRELRPSWPDLRDAWLRGAGLAGSSAGAMALCEHCLTPTPGDDKPTSWAEGLGAIPGVGLAVHATTRPGSWLRHVVEISRSRVIALDDATGVIVTNSDEPRVVGTGRVWIAS